MLYSILIVFCALLPLQFALNPTAGIDLAIVRIIIPAFFLGYLFSCLKRKNCLWPKNKTTVFLGLFLLLAGLSLFFSANLSWSLRKLLFLFSIAPIYLLTFALANTAQKSRRVLVALVSGGFVLSIIGILQFFSQFVFGIEKTYAFLAKFSTPFFLGNSFSEAVLAYPSWLVNSGGVTYMRAFGIFPDPHMFSFYMGMLLPWSVALWATSKNHKLLFFVSSSSLALADIFSFTRGGYVAIIVASLVIIPLVSKKIALKIILGSLVFALMFILVPHSPVSQRLSSSFDANEGSNKERLSNWDQALHVIQAHPFGVGIGGYSLAVDRSAAYREPIYAHNLYLDIAAELGILALLIFVAALISVFFGFYGLAKNDPFWIAGVASLLVFAVHCLVESPLYSVHVLPLILIIFALSGAQKTNGQNPC